MARVRGHARQGIWGSERGAQPVPQLVSGGQSSHTMRKLHPVPHRPGRAGVESSRTGQGPQAWSHRGPRSHHPAEATCGAEVGRSNLFGLRAFPQIGDLAAWSQFRQGGGGGGEQNLPDRSTLREAEPLALFPWSSSCLWQETTRVLASPSGRGLDCAQHRGRKQPDSQRLSLASRLSSQVCHTAQGLFQSKLSRFGAHSLLWEG